jgi:hypothetical protein
MTSASWLGPRISMLCVRRVCLYLCVRVSVYMCVCLCHTGDKTIYACERPVTSITCIHHLGYKALAPFDGVEAPSGLNSLFKGLATAPSLISLHADPTKRPSPTRSLSDKAGPAIRATAQPASVGDGEAARVAQANAVQEVWAAA